MVCWLLQLGLAEELVAQLLERRWSSQLEQLSCRDVDIDADARAGENLACAKTH
jgi:hypothetical protein